MDIKTITSAQNPLLKEVARLQKPSYARRQGLFLVEGVRAVSELLKAKDWKIRYFLLDGNRQREYAPLVNAAALREAQVIATSADIIGHLSQTVNTQGVLAVAERRSFNLEEVLKSQPKSKNGFLLMVTENLQDPGNIGTILRSADAMGADAVIVCGNSVDIYNDKVIRAAMGSVLHLPVCVEKDTVTVVNKLKSEGIQVLAAHLKGSGNLQETDLTVPTALMVGNEGNGLTEEASRASSKLVRIPMPGQAESLNAAVSAAILLYECVRQRMESGK